MGKIYTKTGDKGKTSLFDGSRVAKNDIRVETYGTIDELNSLVGIIVSKMQKEKGKNQKYNAKLKSELTILQNDLFDIGSLLADPTKTSDKKMSRYLQERTEVFEKHIDEMTAKMPLLANFIIPGGGKVGSFLHLARTVCRRAERRLVALSLQNKVDQEIIIYFNRLSDLLFTMARFANYKEKKKDILWVKLV